MPRYRLIDHTADMGVFFYGADCRELMANAALVLFEFLLDKPPRRGNEKRKVTLDGLDREDLLIRWLSELLYLFQVEKKVLTGVEIIDLTEDELTAVLRLAPFKPAESGIKSEIKAATYHQVELKPVKNGWRARVIFDL